MSIPASNACPVPDISRWLGRYSIGQLRVDAWYTTQRGRRVDAAERGLLLHLLGRFHNAPHTVEVGCGTGHFAAFLAQHGLSMIAVDVHPQC